MGRFSAAHPDCVMSRKAGVLLDRIVIHTMEGTLRGSEAWFKQGRDVRPVPTAAHYLIGRDGEVVQMVHDEKKCYHAGNYNSRSIGVEHEARTQAWPVRRDKDGKVKAPPFPTDDFTDPMLDASALVVAILCRKYGIPVDREHIIGHVEVPGATHTDPGSAWPWVDYMARVGAVC